MLSNFKRLQEFRELVLLGESHFRFPSPAFYKQSERWSTLSFFHYRVSHIYCLYVKDTVEERILNLAAKRKRSLYLKNGNEEQINSSILDVKSREDQPASAIKKLDAKGDLVSNDKDLLACLFDDREADGGSKDDEQTHRREDSSSSQVSS